MRNSMILMGKHKMMETFPLLVCRKIPQMEPSLWTGIFPQGWHCQLTKSRFKPKIKFGMKPQNVTGLRKK